MIKSIYVSHAPDISQSVGSVTDTHGGQNLSVALAIPYDAQELLNWVRGYKKQIEQEEKLRREIPHIKEAWDAYRMTLTIAQE